MDFPERQTNEERSTRTREALLDATLECLIEKGYAGMTTNDVVKRAGVSRGALAHHFPSKTELVAAASVHLIRRRQEMLARQILDNDQGDLGFRERLDMIRQEYTRWFPATIEFMVAARTDEHLSRLFSEEMEPHAEELTDLSLSEFAEFSNHSSPHLIQYVLGCFVRGLCLERIVNSDELVDEIFEEFSRMLEVYARHG